jgi:hypothetical protein
VTPDDIATAVRAALPAADRSREVRMFGGIGFMIDGNMVVAASKGGLLARVGEAVQAKSASTSGVRPMEMNGRIMKDYVFVDPGALSKAAVGKWLKLALGICGNAACQACRQDGKGKGETEMMRLILAMLAYLSPTFALGFAWHLVLFEQYYSNLQIYRADIIIPFGFVSMLIQGALFAWIYAKAFAPSSAGFAARTIAYGALGAVLSWSFTTLAVAAKNIMASVPDFMLIETGYTIVQWAMVAPLTVWVFSRPAKTAASAPV